MVRDQKHQTLQLAPRARLFNLSNLSRWSALLLASLITSCGAMQSSHSQSFQSAKSLISGSYKSITPCLFSNSDYWNSDSRVEVVVSTAGNSIEVKTQNGGKLRRNDCSSPSPTQPYDNCFIRAWDCLSHDDTGSRCMKYFNPGAVDQNVPLNKIRVSGSRIQFMSCTLELK